MLFKSNGSLFQSFGVIEENVVYSYMLVYIYDCTDAFVKYYDLYTTTLYCLNDKTRGN